MVGGHHFGVSIVFVSIIFNNVLLVGSKYKFIYFETVNDIQIGVFRWISELLV